MSADLHRFFWPESIALVGVSEDPKSIRGRVLDFLLRHGYPGAIYPVSLTRRSVAGLTAYRSVADIPGPVDLAILSVQADQLPAVVENCVRKRVRFAFCFTSGFAEAGAEGLRQQQALAASANAGGVRLAGPNSAGMFNAPGRVPVTFTRTTELEHLRTFARPFVGPLGFVAQSGGLGFAMQHRVLAHHGVGCSYVVSTGNEADLDCFDYAEYMLGEEHSRVVVLIVEGFRNGSRLPALAQLARDKNKTLIVAKFGSTVAGGRAASSHSARLTGDDAAYDAMFRRYGLVRAHDEDELSDLCAGFARYPLPRGRRVAILTTSGGAGVWMADACEREGLVVPPLDAATEKRMREFMPAYGSAANPIDLTAQTSLNPLSHGKSKSTLFGAIEALDASAAIDAVVVVANLSDGDLLARERAGLSETVPRLTKPLLFFSHAAPSSSSLELLWDAGLCCFSSSRRTARVLAALAAHGEFLKHDLAPEITQDIRSLSAIPSRALCEYEAKSLLAAAGLRFPPERLVRSEDEAVHAARELGFPVALKIQSPDMLHKTELGGVVLNVGKSDAACDVGATDAAMELAAAEAVREAYRLLLDRTAKAAPEANVHGVLVQPMLKRGIEMMAGIVHDATFGPMLVAGFGGTLVEVLRDTVMEPVPVDARTARAMLDRLRGRALLEGVRGEPAADVDAFIDLLVRLSEIAHAAGGRIAEIDVNPVFAYRKGEGVAIADALLIGREP
jgi:acyl-CoA synthetase (NDP forming)